jgi:predicted O-methyltransferase YrrM
MYKKEITILEFGYLTDISKIWMVSGLEENGDLVSVT